MTLQLSTFFNEYTERPNYILENEESNRFGNLDARREKLVKIFRNFEEFRIAEESHFKLLAMTKRVGERESLVKKITFYAVAGVTLIDSFVQSFLHRSSILSESESIFKPSLCGFPTSLGNTPPIMNQNALPELASDLSWYNRIYEFFVPSSNLSQSTSDFRNCSSLNTSQLWHLRNVKVMADFFRGGFPLKVIGGAAIAAWIVKMVCQLNFSASFLGSMREDSTKMNYEMANALRDRVQTAVNDNTNPNLESVVKKIDQFLDENDPILSNPHGLNPKMPVDAIDRAHFERYINMIDIFYQRIRAVVISNPTQIN